MRLQPSNDDNLPAVYDLALTDVADILDAAHRASARSVNSIMTAAYWLVGRRIVEYEQGGEARAEYGAELIRRLSVDLNARYGRGFSVSNLRQMRAFYLARPILRTASGEFVSPIPQSGTGENASQIRQTLSGESMLPIPQSETGENSPLDITLSAIAPNFPLPWSA